MNKAGFVLLLIFFSCAAPQEQAPVSKTDTLQKQTSSEAYAAIPEKDTVVFEKPKTEQVKNPSGIYQFFLPYKGVKIEHTVRFNSNHVYRLQERYINGKTDSVVITEGTWMPSNGFIWLYKEQLVQGRYQWKERVLNYFNPGTKKTYPMAQLTDVMTNTAWKNKNKEGVVAYGIGNEPFWSVELTNKDTLNFLLSDWSSPLKLKLTETSAAKDSTVFFAQNDTARLQLVVLPRFCNDGMSDFIYSNKIEVRYSNQVFSGCGVLYK